MTSKDTPKLWQRCKVCGELAAGFHFGAFTCEGCKSFFGRTYSNLSALGECKNSGRCVITKKTRTSCKSCRLNKCLVAGMSKSGSRYGRRSNWFKIHYLMQGAESEESREEGDDIASSTSPTLLGGTSEQSHRCSPIRSELKFNSPQTMETSPSYKSVMMAEKRLSKDSANAMEDTKKPRKGHTTTTETNLRSMVRVSNSGLYYNSSRINSRPLDIFPSAPSYPRPFESTGDRLPPVSMSPIAAQAIFSSGLSPFALPLHPTQCHFIPQSLLFYYHSLILGQLTEAKSSQLRIQLPSSSDSNDRPTHVDPAMADANVTESLLQTKYTNVGIGSANTPHQTADFNQNETQSCSVPIQRGFHKDFSLKPEPMVKSNRISKIEQDCIEESQLKDDHEHRCQRTSISATDHCDHQSSSALDVPIDLSTSNTKRLEGINVITAIPVTRYIDTSKEGQHIKRIEFGNNAVY